MGRQVGFFAHGRDLVSVLHAAAEAEYFALDEVMEEGATPRVHRAEDGVPTEHGRFFLVPPEVDVGGLDFGAPVSIPGTRALAWWRAPIIEVSVSLRVGNVLQPGRIYLPTSTSSTPSEQRFERRYPSLPKVYARMARMVKRWSKTTSPRLYVGPDAAAEVQTGALELGHFQERFLPLD